MLVSVVTYGAEEETRTFLHAFLAAVRAEPLDVGIVVVDNFERYSAEEKAAIHERWDSDGIVAAWIDLDADTRAPELLHPIPAVTCIFTNRNLGYARGNNIAFAAAEPAGRRPYFLVITGDVVLESERSLSRLMDALRQHPEAGVAGPRIVGDDGRDQGPFHYQGVLARYGTLAFAPVTRIVTGSYLLPDRIRNLESGYVYRLMGCALLFRSNDFDRAGRFDERTFLYAEESIMSERLAAIGKRCVYIGDVRMRHRTGTTIRRHHDAVSVLRMRFESDCYYFQRYRNVSALSILLARAAVTLFTRVYLPAGRLLRLSGRGEGGGRREEGGGRREERGGGN